VSIFDMSMAELMRVVASLPVEQQDELAAFLLHLRLQQDPAWRKTMTERIDDKRTENWITLEDWKKEIVPGEER
jgi:hypothetical protein